MNILEVEHLTRVYGSGDTAVTALDDVSFSVEAGEFIAIIGSSGSGKSTLMHLMGGVDRPTSGTVKLQGQDIFARSDEQLAVFRRREVGLVYQFYNLIPVLDVVENMTLPVLMDGRTINEQRLSALMRALGLTGREHYLPNQLSGGQQQRVAIGRALMNAPLRCSRRRAHRQSRFEKLRRDHELVEGLEQTIQADPHRHHPRRGCRAYGRPRDRHRGRPRRE